MPLDNNFVSHSSPPFEQSTSGTRSRIVSALMGSRTGFIKRWYWQTVQLEERFQARKRSKRLPNEKLGLTHPLARGAFTVLGTLFTLSITVCPISWRRASMAFISTGFPEQSLT
ncbi:hypothetical protein Taro_034458 [Colocasia esculenta]|uniref:Uncharacterized protein n=1 Tax=Colocasia esculenta TaxID=4460 RepID=A0A843VXV6_COLES|nr:hypothetical protein [Colocasia esculenta]